MKEEFKWFIGFLVVGFICLLVGLMMRPVPITCSNQLYVEEVKPVKWRWM